jgi:hypothetical protein
MLLEATQFAAGQEIKAAVAAAASPGPKAFNWPSERRNLPEVVAS